MPMPGSMLPPHFARLAGFARRAWLAAGMLAAATLSAQEAPRAPGLDQQAAIRASQAAIGRSVGDYTLLDREGRPVRLASYRGKPLLVSFIYTGCFQVCPTTTRSLDETVRALQGRFGDNQFNVLSIGFNQPFDSPPALKTFAAQQRISRSNWDFLSPPAAIVGPLTQNFGFLYESTPAGFDHVLQVSLVDAEGRIVRQVYGDRPAADMLGEPMKHMLAGAPLPPQNQLAELIDRIRILCTVYDPKTGTYRPDYGLFIQLGGGLTFILLVAGYMFNEWRARRRARRPAQPA
jgi:protein SCO1